MPVELELDLHLVARHRFPTNYAGPPGAWRTEHAVRTARWQLPTPDRFSGLLLEDRLVGHDNLSRVASPRFAPRFAPDPIRPDACTRHAGSPMGGDRRILRRLPRAVNPWMYGDANGARTSGSA
jgi:hypothetical protein